MPRFEVVRDPHEAGLHAGAGKSLKLTIRQLKEYLASGALPRVGNDVGTRRDQSDLLQQCLEFAQDRGAERERNRIAVLLQTPVSRNDNGDSGGEAGGAVIVPLHRRRLAR